MHDPLTRREALKATATAVGGLAVTAIPRPSVALTPDPATPPNASPAYWDGSSPAVTPAPVLSHERTPSGDLTSTMIWLEGVGAAWAAETVGPGNLISIKAGPELSRVQRPSGLESYIGVAVNLLVFVPVTKQSLMLTVWLTPELVGEGKSAMHGYLRARLDGEYQFWIG